MNIRKTIAIRRGLLTLHALALDAYEAGVLEKPPRWHAQDAAELQRALDWVQEQASRGHPPLP